MSEFGSNTGGLTIDDTGVTNTGIRLSHGNDDTYLVQFSNSILYFPVWHWCYDIWCWFIR